MSNQAKHDYSSDDEEDEESESEEEEQPKVVKNKVESKSQERHPQDEEESSEEEEDSETDNDAHRYNTVRREGNIAGAAKAANHTNPAGKRGRDVEGKDEEPATKKSKESKGDRGRTVVKPASPTRSIKGDPGGKGSKASISKAKSLPVEKEESTKAAPANRKRKASPPAVNGSSRHKEDGNGKNSPQRPKAPFMWTNPLEIALATMLWNDKKHGGPLPRTKNDPYWTKLVKELTSEGVAITEAQLSEKVRRMKKKWEVVKAKGGDNPGKTAHEQKLFGIWEGIWGTGSAVGKQAARPGTPPPPPNEEEEGEESSEEEEVATPAIRPSKVPATPSRKEESSDEEEEEEEEESPEPRKGGLNTDGTSFSPAAVVSPFVSKPRLEYTPIHPKVDRKKTSRRGDDGSIAEQGGAEESPDEEEPEGGSSAAVIELLNSLKKESFSIIQEVRSSCLDAVNSIRKQAAMVGLNMPAPGTWRMNRGSVPSLDRGLLDDFMTNTLLSGENGANGSSASELKSLWRQLRAEEMDLLEKKIQLTLKQVKLARKEFEEHDK